MPVGLAPARSYPATARPERPLDEGARPSAIELVRRDRRPRSASAGALGRR